jgi:hypothetical protein
MAGAGGFSISISAVDKSTSTLDALNKRLAALNAPTEKFNRALNKFGDVSGISRVSEGFASLARTSGDAFRNIDRIADPFAALTSAASIAGLAALTSRFADLGSSTGRMAYQLDIPVGKYSTLIGSAKRYGASVDAVRSSLNAIHEEIYGAVFNKNQADVAKFAMLGINPGTVDRPADDLSVFKQIADRVAATKDIHGKENILDQYHIDRALLPMMNGGSAGIQAAMDRTKFLGGEITEQMVKNATRMQVALDDLSTAMGGIATRLGDKLSQLMAGPVEKLDNWIGNNKSTADKAAVAGSAGGVALGLRLGRPLLRLVGMGALSDTALPIAAAAAGAIATYYNGLDSATGQDRANRLGYTEVAGVDDSGMPTSYRDPKSGSTKSWMEFDPRYNPAIRPRVTQPDYAGPAILRPRGPTNAAGTMQRMHDFFRGKGLSEEVTAGILANASAESGFDPGALGDKQNGQYTSYGLFQEHASRMSAMMKRYGANPSADDQMNFAWDELNTTHKSTLDAMNADPHNERRAGAIFAAGFEGPKGGVPEALRRGDAAGQFVQGGGVEVNVRFDNAPPGMRADVKTSGNVRASPPAIGTTLPYAH